MSDSPFLNLLLRRKKDIVVARHRARQLAQLLKFPVQEQACIAAGTFAVAVRASAGLGKCHLCFQLDDNHLRVYARSVSSDIPTSTGVSRISGFADTEGLLRLEKPLPQAPDMSQSDLAWLVQNGDKGAGLFAEVVRQNDEVLMLLHELRLSRQQTAADQPGQPSAA